MHHLDLFLSRNTKRAAETLLQKTGELESGSRPIQLKQNVFFDGYFCRQHSSTAAGFELCVVGESRGRIYEALIIKSYWKKGNIYVPAIGHPGVGSGREGLSERSLPNNSPKSVRNPVTAVTAAITSIGRDNNPGLNWINLSLHKSRFTLLGRGAWENTLSPCTHWDGGGFGLFVEVV
ncbi:hypothetical protein CEXT_250341 [Caerostris extrusa]|uniref:Uncharacterized protein n=1 Tax=Caerostris extrusa TaxID=172846 RepID=A0AAV4N2C5_CAEEX|nr:hypothetical protein CEXT_250341 [Caerostris extrusa]